MEQKEQGSPGVAGATDELARRACTALTDDALVTALLLEGRVCRLVEELRELRLLARELYG